jgi:predicted MPP superfamily phosphohydrolase
MIRIIHVSDYHLDKEKASGFKAKIIKALANDLKSFVNDTTLLFFTGDLIDIGGKGFPEKVNPYKSFELNFIKIIVEANPLLENKVFVVPGNHDIQRSLIEPITEDGLKSHLISEKNVDDFVKSSRTSLKHLDRIYAYKEWERIIMLGILAIIFLIFDSSSIVEMETLKLVLLVKFFLAM